MADAAARSTRTLSRKRTDDADARRVRRGGLALALLFFVTAAVGVACGSIGDPLGPPGKPQPTGSGGSGGARAAKACSAKYGTDKSFVLWLDRPLAPL